MPDDPKGIAAAILGPPVEASSDDGGDASESSSETQTAALAATADQMMGALKSGDREGLIDALRSLLMLKG